MRGNVLAFVSIKGGVGKTTLALETAASLANHYGKKVLLVDGNFSAPNVGLYLDLTNKITKEDATLHDALMGIGLPNAIYEAHGFDVVPASLDYSGSGDVDIFRLKKVLSKAKHRYDFVIIDSSPNYEELKPVIAAADRVFVVTTPDEVTLKTSLKAARLARLNKTPVEGIVINRIRRPKYELEMDHIQDSSDIPVVARIKDHKKMVEAMFHKTPITLHDSDNCISREIRRFVAALCGEPEELGGLFQRFLPFKDLIHREKVNRELMRKKFYSEQL